LTAPPSVPKYPEKKAKRSSKCPFSDYTTANLSASLCFFQSGIIFHLT